MNKDKTKGWLGQTSIIRSLEKKFSEEAMKHGLGLTPGTPRFIAMRVPDEEDKLPAKEHATYRSGVGTLLYLTKHSSSRSLPSWTLLAVLWQMCHVWITYRTSSGPVLTMDKLSRL